MRWEATATAESDAPPAAVWDAIVDGRRWSFWHDRFEWMWLEGPLERGSIATVKPRRVRQTAFAIKEAVPQRRLVLETRFGPVARVKLLFSLEERAAGSRVTYSVVVDGLLAGLAVRMIGKRLSDGAPEALAKLAIYAAEAEKEEAR